MNTIKTYEDINHCRRRLLNTAAMGIAVAGVAKLFPSQLVAAAAADAIRPFRVTYRTSNSSISADASQRPAGRTKKRPVIARRAINSGSSRKSSVTGEPIMTGGKSKRD
jgi:hypothetical protein